MVRSRHLLLVAVACGMSLAGCRAVYGSYEKVEEADDAAGDGTTGDSRSDDAGDTSVDTFTVDDTSRDAPSSDVVAAESSTTDDATFAGDGAVDVRDSATTDTADTADTAASDDTGMVDTASVGDACASATDAASTAKPYTEYVWTLWPLAPDSPGGSNYTVATVCGDKVVTDKTTSLMWAQEEEPGTFTWADAKTRCAGSRRAGFTDWRLPTRMELVSLIDLGKTSAPTINTAAFPGATNGGNWSSSPFALSPGKAWYVGFGGGYTGINDVTMLRGARCVR